MLNMLKRIEGRMLVRKRTIKFRICLLVIILIVLTVTAEFFIMVSFWKRSSSNFISSIADHENEAIANKTDDLINIPIDIINNNHSLIEKGIVDIDYQDERDMYFVNILVHSNPAVYSYSYGAAGGAYYGARRNENNQIEIMKNDAETNGHSWYYAVTDSLTAGAFVEDHGYFDCRTRDWYQAAIECGGPIYSSVYKHFVMDDMTVSASYAIYSEQGELEGVLGAHMVLSGLNEYLKHYIETPNAKAYIIEKDTGFLVANSLDQPNFNITPENDFERISILDTGCKSVISAYQDYMDNSSTSSHFETRDGQLYIKITEYKNHGLEWIIVTSLPDSLFTADINRSIGFISILGVCSLLILIIIWIVYTDAILKPIYELIETTQKFSRGDLHARANIYRNDEIGTLATTFNNMAKQLNKQIHTLEDTVTERTNALERASQNANQLIQELNNKNHFLGVLSHELRNPLASIVAGVTLLNLTDDKQHSQKAKEIIQRQTTHLRRLVDDLLDITRITQNKLAIKKEEIDLIVLISNLINDSKQLFLDKNITLKMHIQADPLIIYADEVRISQAIENILHNAIKFSHKDGEIELTVHRTPNSAVIKISDQGVGISQDLLPYLFDVFIQADNSLDRPKGGLGLGLAIVKNIIELHGGMVQAYSDGLGYGAEFIISLPIL